MSGLRWVFTAGRAHVLAANSDGERRTVCGLRMPSTVIDHPVPPSLDVCQICVRLPGDDEPTQPGRTLDLPPPTHGTPAVI